MAGRNTTVASLDHQVSIGTSNGFFVQEVARNNQSISETTDDAYQTLYKYTSTSGTGALQSWSQYLVTSGAGDYVAPVGDPGDNFKIIVTAGFEAIPEPSSALLAISGLAFLFLRRQRHQE